MDRAASIQGRPVPADRAVLILALLVLEALVVSILAPLVRVVRVASILAPPVREVLADSTRKRRAVADRVEVGPRESTGRNTEAVSIAVGDD